MPLETTVLTPEKTVLTYRLAGLGSRALAHFIDVICIILIIYLGSVIASLFVVITLEMLSNTIGAIFGAIASLLPFAYFIFSEGLMNGVTLGKKLVGLRVRMADGTPVTFAASVARNIIRVADFLPFGYFVGTVAMFVNPRLQRLGDLVAGTIVVHEGKVSDTFSVAPHRVGVHPLEHTIGELRNMTDAQYEVLRRYCDRFPEVPAETQNELTTSVWLPLAKNIGVTLDPEIHPLYLAEATVMKYGRLRGML